MTRAPRPTLRCLLLSVVLVGAAVTGGCGANPQGQQPVADLRLYDARAEPALVRIDEAATTVGVERRTNPFVGEESGFLAPK